MKAPQTVREAVKVLRGLGISLSVTREREYRVTFSQVEMARRFPSIEGRERLEKTEAVASYETDLPSAFDTALAMSGRS